METCSKCGELLEEPVDVYDKGYCEEITYDCPNCGNLEIKEVPK